jgi:hypothetical protein
VGKPLLARNRRVRALIAAPALVVVLVHPGGAHGAILNRAQLESVTTTAQRAMIGKLESKLPHVLMSLPADGRVALRLPARAFRPPARALRPPKPRQVELLARRLRLRLHHGRSRGLSTGRPALAAGRRDRVGAVAGVAVLADRGSSQLGTASLVSAAPDPSRSASIHRARRTAGARSGGADTAVVSQPVFPTFPVGGPSNSASGGTATGVAFVALIAGAILWLALALLPSRLSIDLLPWRSALFSSRLERPG